LSIAAPVFNFVKAYIFQLGFLDRRNGFIIAKINAQYTKRKYQHLCELIGKKGEVVPEGRILQKSFRKMV